jgi:hypothetical protein
MQRFTTIEITNRDLLHDMQRNRDRDYETNDRLIIRYRDKRHAHSLACVARQRALRLSR